MKSIVLLVLSLFTAIAMADAPFLPEVDARLKKIEAGTTINFTSGDVTSLGGVTAIGVGKVLEAMLQVPLTDGLNAKRIAKAHYDFAVNGGAQSAISLGTTLPAGAIITRSWIYTKTQVAGASSTVALSCETANNIFSAASMTSIVATTITEGVSTGAASVFKPITAACAITATIATANVTAGYFDVYVEYVVHD